MSEFLDLLGEFIIWDEPGWSGL